MNCRVFSCALSRNHTRLFCLFLFVLFLAIPVMAVCSEESVAVARVYSRTIFLDELQPSRGLKSKTMQRLGPGIYQDWLGQFQVRTLRDVLLKALSATYLQQTGMEPTVEEVDAYLRYLDGRARNVLAEFQIRRDELYKKFKASAQGSSERQELQARISEADRLIVDMQEGVGETEQLQAQRRHRGEQVVGEWKFNKALYERYGGRVFCRNASLEPVDAIRRMLEDGIHDMVVVILAPEFADLFNGYESGQGTFSFEVDRSDAEAYFRTPWWSVDYSGRFGNVKLDAHAQ